MQLNKQKLSRAALAVTALFWGHSLLAVASPGAATFKAKCAGCHGADAAGDTVMGKKFKLRDLRSADVQKRSDDDLAALITTGKTPMPAFGKTLDAAAIHEIVVYIRSIASKS